LKPCPFKQSGQLCCSTCTQPHQGGQVEVSRKVSRNRGSGTPREPIRSRCRGRGVVFDAFGQDVHFIVLERDGDAAGGASEGSAELVLSSCHRAVQPAVRVALVFPFPPYDETRCSKQVMSWVIPFGGVWLLCSQHSSAFANTGARGMHERRRKGSRESEEKYTCTK
jgi:hypothetical protein